MIRNVFVLISSIPWFVLVARLLRRWLMADTLDISAFLYELPLLPIGMACCFAILLIMNPYLRKIGTSVYISDREVRVVEWYGRQWSFPLRPPVTIAKTFQEPKSYMLRSDGYRVYISFPDGTDHEEQALSLGEFLSSQGIQVDEDASD